MRPTAGMGVNRRAARLHEGRVEMETAVVHEYRYNRLTWPEMNEAIARQPVVILPTASTEQHGRHLPIDVDLLLTETICLEIGKRANGNVLVLPAIPYGLNMHHIDFPGTIHIEPEVFIAFCLNITKSVAYHGFEKILIVNGHGSNAPLIDIIARRTTLETGSLCAACHYINLAVERFREIMESAVIAHADEFETSLYLYIAPERVQMEKAGQDNDVMGAYVSSDSTSPYVRFNDYWSRWTDLGVHGDARPATAEKGRIIFETAVERMLELAEEWRHWPLAARRDFHERPVQDFIRW
jgi:creatinine amidohydrolase